MGGAWRVYKSHSTKSTRHISNKPLTAYSRLYRQIYVVNYLAFAEHLEIDYYVHVHYIVYFYKKMYRTHFKSMISEQLLYKDTRIFFFFDKKISSNVV